MCCGSAYFFEIRALRHSFRHPRGFATRFTTLAGWCAVKGEKKTRFFDSRYALAQKDTEGGVRVVSAFAPAAP